ncbi:hypothetical protein PLUTE_b0485 [Pseudoalteromonas luteoviolacea DSM 6061]|nr:hypothetical protein [Pseudoalteromonas luteoviolacea DSM 6061]
MVMIVTISGYHYISNELLSKGKKLTKLLEAIVAGDEGQD